MTETIFGSIQSLDDPQMRGELIEKGDTLIILGSESGPMTQVLCKHGIGSVFSIDLRLAWLV